MTPMIWLGLVAVLLLAEAMTVGLTTIWFAGGALVAAIASFFQVNLVIQVLLFLVISLVLLIFTRPWATRFMNSNREKTNVDSLIGESAVILEKVDNLKETGKAQVRGMEWTVRTEKDEETVEKGEVVTIVKVQGVKLIVKRRKEEIL